MLETGLGLLLISTIIGLPLWFIGNHYLGRGTTKYSNGDAQ